MSSLPETDISHTPPARAGIAGLVLPLAMGLLLLLMLTPLGAQGERGRALIDGCHGPVFAVLCWAIGRRWTASLGRSPWLQATAAWCAAVLFGALVECAQMFTGRTASWDDLRANMLGALAGAAILLLSTARTRSLRVALLATSVAALALALYPTVRVFAHSHRVACRTETHGANE